MEIRKFLGRVFFIVCGAFLAFIISNMLYYKLGNPKREVAFEGILSWKLTMDVGVWLVLLIRFAGYRKKEEISGEDMIWEIGILLLYTGIVLSDFAHIGMLPYSGGIFMLVGVIAFDLSVNVIDRWRMNKIQQRALEAAKIEQKLQEARLELALHQIKPHFL